MEQPIVNFVPTRIFRENRTSSAKIHLNRGGTRSSKTYNIVALAVLWMTQGKGGNDEVWSITRKTLPALRASAYRDFREIMTNLKLWDVVHANLSDLVFSFNNRSVEFFSLDDQTKVRSRKRDYLHIVEADEISYAIWHQLVLRTKKKVFADWNPDDPFHWLREEVEMKRSEQKGDVKVIVSTYRDNPHLTPEEVAEIEYLKEVDPELWAVFGEGEYGKLTDVIFKDTKVEPFPDDCDYTYIGVDFGFSSDPAACVLVGRKGQNIYLKELVYETRLTNEQLANKIEATGYLTKQGVADSAEPKSITELNSRGMQLAGAVKGPDSVRSGVLLMREFHIHIDPGSLNLLKEFRVYKWSDKKAGVPVDAWNHGIDATRYVVQKFMRGGQTFKLGGMVSGTQAFQA